MSGRALNAEFTNRTVNAKPIKRWNIILIIIGIILALILLLSTFQYFFKATI